MNNHYKQIIKLLTEYEAKSASAELNLKWDVGKEFDKEIQCGIYADKPSKAAMDMSEQRFELSIVPFQDPVPRGQDLPVQFSTC